MVQVASLHNSSKGDMVLRGVMEIENVGLAIFYKKWSVFENFGPGLVFLATSKKDSNNTD